MKGTARPRSRARMPAGLRDLALLAREARQKASAPFSRFKVGAALRTRAGEVVTGCNVESASYGLTMCAERVAIFKAVSEGLRLTAPCGACRQVLWELGGDLWVHIVNLHGRSRTVRMSDLLPLPFDARNL
jgi:cytidine deaminase